MLLEDSPWSWTFVKRRVSKESKKIRLSIRVTDRVGFRLYRSTIQSDFARLNINIFVHTSLSFKHRKHHFEHYKIKMVYRLNYNWFEQEIPKFKYESFSTRQSTRNEPNRTKSFRTFASCRGLLLHMYTRIYIYIRSFCILSKIFTKKV